MFSNYNAQLAEIIENLSDINTDITEINEQLANMSNDIINSMFMPIQKRYDQYKNNVRRIITSYMSRNNFSTCVTGDIISDGNVRPLWQYNNEAKGLYGNIINPQYTFKKASLLKQYAMEVGTITQINGIDYNNMYADCSTLTYLICAGIDYLNSPYYYGNATEEPDLDQLINLSMGNRDLNYFWGIDFKGQIIVDKMAMNLEGSGNTLKYVAEQSFGNNAVYYDVIVNQMETGDLVFLGSQSDSTKFNGIHHCGVYVKTLDELNSYGTSYNQTYHTFDNKISERGYIVDCDASTSPSNVYTNVIKIQTLESWLERFPPSAENTWQAVYTAKPFPNGMNSNKLGNNTVYQQWANAKYFNNYSGPDLHRIVFDTLNGCINTGSFGATGIAITEDYDYDELTTPGIYYPANNKITRPNGPASYETWQFHLIIVLGGLNTPPTGTGKYIVQICIPAGGGTGPICYRTKYKTWSNWLKLQGEVDA